MLFNFTQLQGDLSICLHTHKLIENLVPQTFLSSYTLSVQPRKLRTRKLLEREQNGGNMSSEPYGYITIICLSEVIEIDAHILLLFSSKRLSLSFERLTNPDNELRVDLTE